MTTPADIQKAQRMVAEWRGEHGVAFRPEGAPDVGRDYPAIEVWIDHGKVAAIYAFPLDQRDLMVRAFDRIHFPKSGELMFFRKDPETGSPVESMFLTPLAATFVPEEETRQDLVGDIERSRERIADFVELCRHDFENWVLGPVS